MAAKRKRTKAIRIPKPLLAAAPFSGPEFYPLAIALKQLKLQPYIVSESAGTQIEDAGEMKRIYESL